MPATHTIQITANGGNFIYTPAVQHALPNDMISWLSHDGPFTVSFIGETPFDVVSISGQKDIPTTAKGFGTTQHPVRPGTYHYAAGVAVTVGSVTTVHLNTGCPEIIIP